MFCDCPKLALLLDQFGDKAGPAGLVRSAQAGAVVAMEIFVKQIAVTMPILQVP